MQRGRAGLSHLVFRASGPQQQPTAYMTPAVELHTQPKSPPFASYAGPTEATTTTAATATVVAATTRATEPTDITFHQILDTSTLQQMAG